VLLPGLDRLDAREGGAPPAGLCPDQQLPYRCRYGDERRRLEQLAAELGCADSAVRGDLQRLGLGPDRTRSHGARWRSAR